MKKRANALIVTDYRQSRTYIPLFSQSSPPVNKHTNEHEDLRANKHTRRHETTVKGNLDDCNEQCHNWTWDSGIFYFGHFFLLEFRFLWDSPNLFKNHFSLFPSLFFSFPLSSLHFFSSLISSLFLSLYWRFLFISIRYLSSVSLAIRMPLFSPQDCQVYLR